MSKVVHTNKELYGEDFQPHLLEQYKVVRGRIVDVINDRNTQNRYLFTVLTVTLAVPVLVLRAQATGESVSPVLALIALFFPVMGAILSYWWIQWNTTFGQAIGAGYRLLTEMEVFLPAQPFTVEPTYRKEMGEGEHRKTTDFTIRLPQLYLFANIVFAVAVVLTLLYAS